MDIKWQETNNLRILETALNRWVVIFQAVLILEFSCYTYIWTIKNYKIYNSLESNLITHTALTCEHNFNLLWGMGTSARQTTLSECFCAFFVNRDVPLQKEAFAPWNKAHLAYRKANTNSYHVSFFWKKFKKCTKYFTPLQ